MSNPNEFKNPFLDVPKNEVVRSTLIIPYKIQAAIKNYEPKDGAIQTTISILLQKLTHELSTSGIEVSDRAAYHRAVADCTIRLGGVTIAESTAPAVDIQRGSSVKSTTGRKPTRTAKSSR